MKIISEKILIETPLKKLNSRALSTWTLPVIISSMMVMLTWRLMQTTCCRRI